MLSKPGKRQRREEARQLQVHAVQQRSFWHKILAIGAACGLLIVLLIGWQQGWWGGPREPHPYDAFAQCLTDAGLVMYGTDWCPHCQDQKAMFGVSFDFIDYVNCDFNQAVCQAKGIEGYPTWYHDDQLWTSGVQTFNSLSGVSGCEMPELKS